MLEKRWIHTKENKSGRVERKTVIYYKESKAAALVFNEAISSGLTTPAQIKENRIDERILNTDIPVVEEMKEEVPKRPEPKRKSAIDLLTTLSFDEALGKLYRGSKIVSAVSGNIYAMLPGKGITSTTNPGAIVTTFPPLEMEGTWRVFESPKGCPYCGMPVRLVHENIGEKAYYYVCTSQTCAAHGPRALTPEQAVLKFNERV